MQSLQDYLSNTTQYESILDPNQNQVMNRMTDDMIRQRIQEYCTFDRQKRRRSECWIMASRSFTVTKIGKDSNGWYIDTDNRRNADYETSFMYLDNEASFYDHCVAEGYKVDKQKGFLIEDLGIYFRWRKHKGILAACDCPILESTDGLPEEIDILQLFGSCEESKKFIVHNKIKVIEIDYINNLKISGNGCKHVVVHPNNGNVNITAPSGTQLYSLDGELECTELVQKLSKS